MTKNYSTQNLRKVSFKDQDLSYALFGDSDLRGADFTGSNLTGADLTHVRTGIPPLSKVGILLAAFIVSLLSGYIAMLAGQTTQDLLTSGEKRLQIAGWFTIVMMFLFIGYSIWKGLGNAIRQLVLPVIITLVILAVIAVVTKWGTGEGLMHISLALLLTVIMFVVGTIARTAAGTLSDILFTVVAVGGGFFGKSVGGGLGTVVLAISCVVISKRALGGAKGFESLRKTSALVISKFGTSFRNARLVAANFSHAKIYNADFSHADVSSVNWEDSQKINCITTDNHFTKKEQSLGR